MEFEIKLEVFYRICNNCTIFVCCGILSIFAVPAVVVRRDPPVTAGHVLLHHSLVGERVDVLLLNGQLLLAPLLQQLLRDDERLAGHSLGQRLEEELTVLQLDVSAQFDDHRAGANRRRVVVNGRLAAAHAFALGLRKKGRRHLEMESKK